MDGTQSGEAVYKIIQMGQQWYAVYTKPRWEKKVDRLLQKGGLESYCPLNKVKKKWSDRFKLVEEPLFKSYVFVHITEQQFQEVRMVNGVLNFVYWNGKPGVVKNEEINSIKKFLNEYRDVTAVQNEIKPKSRVIVSQGVMMGREATVERVLYNFVELEIESLGCKLVAKIEKSNLFPVNDNSNQ